MVTIKRFVAHKMLVRSVFSILLAGVTLVYGQTPSQLPLLTKAGPAVAPNIMLTLDDSGSMAFRHMPEDVFAGGTYATTNPVGGQTVIWDTADNYKTATNYLGVVPGILSSTNYRLLALRSADTNTIYYNPEIRYQPWYYADGVTRRPNSPVTAAYLNPPLVALTASSSTAITIATGSKIFTLNQTGKGFSTGQNVVITSTASPSTQWMYGSISAFNSGTGSITVNVTETAGSGTLADWTFVQSPKIDLTKLIPNGTFTAGSFIVGATYQIVTTGTTSFTAIGAANNNVGTTFVATGPGSGSGTAVATAGTLNGWCFAKATNADCTGATSAFVHDPGVYFRLAQTGGVYSSVTSSGNYTAYTINAASGTTYPKSAARTDCAGSTCSRDEERQNFANWYTYYRLRNLMARGGLMEAFGPEATPITAGNFVIGTRYVITSVGTTSFTSIGAASNSVDTVFTATGAGSGTGTARAIAFRLGFGRINKGSATVDGVSTAVIESSATYGGGGVRDFSYARKQNLYKWLEDMPASNGTPLVKALETVGNYYSRTDTQGPWTDDPSVNTNVVANNKTCRRSYAFLTTDGYWNGAVGTSGNSDNTAGATITGSGTSFTYVPTAPYKDAWSNTLADAAMKYWKTDLQPATANSVPPVVNNTSFWQNMTTYTVGLGVRGTLDPETDLPALTAGTKTWPQAVSGATAANVDDLWHAALNSRGQYFSVKDPAELATAIRTALAGATGGAGATAGVATASTILSNNNRKYVPTFAAGSWNGDITAYALDSSGQVTTAQWTASSRMPAWNSRNIVTFDNTSTTWAGISFDWSSLSSAAQSDLGPVAATYTTQFINFIKGDHSLEGAGNPFRSRIDPAGKPFILGDIVNANPVLIQSNFDGVYTDTAWGGAAAYNAFKATKAARTAVLFASGNDGMLHAFKDTRGTTPATDGQEIFAYVPRTVYSNLSKLADPNYGTTTALQHQYFVDGPLSEADAYVKAPGASSATWRNYLMGSLGSGGRAVFALDVTDTANLNASSVRWELANTDDNDIGYVLAPIRIGVLPSGRWVAIFGNGYSSTNGKAVLFVVDLENASSNDATVRGNAIQKLVLDSSGSNGLGGVTLIHDATTGRTTTIYVGDLKGNLWKLTYNTATNKFEADGGKAFFTATDSGSTAQPISSSPAVFKNGTLGGYMVLFGTGKLFSTADVNDTSTQTVYGVWDKQGGPSGAPDSVSRPLTRSNLVGRTLTAFAGTGLASGTTFYSLTGTAADYSTSVRGWYVDLTPPTTGGRVVYPTQVVGYQTALFSSVAPVQGVPQACDSSTGTALNLLVPVDTGLNATNHIFDTNGDGVANASDAAVSGYATKADGVDAVVSSASTSGGDRLSDTGGGGPVGDCTGDACGKKGNKCVSSPLCPEANTCLASIQSATMGLPVCIYVGAGGTRIWRRIINPPIR